MPESKVVFWGAPDEERLNYYDVDEAIEAILDDWEPEPLTGTLTICGYARAELSPADLDADRILEDVLERLDETYGDPDDMSEPTAAMKKAAQTFVDVIRAEYTPWACVEVERREIDVQAWVREHRPDWLEEDPHV